MKDKVEYAVLSLTAVLSVLISLLDWLGLLESTPFLASKIPNITLLALGLVTGYLVLERRSKLDRIEYLVVASIGDAERRLLQAVALGDLLTKNPELYAIIRHIAERYQSVQDCKFDLFIQRSIDALLECRNILGSLERGYLITEVAGKFSYGKRGTEAAQKTVKAIDYEDVEAWRTEHLKSVILANAEAVNRGVQIQRVFILKDESLAKASVVLQAHKDAGVQVHVVSPEDLPSTQLLESYLIVDDRILVSLII
jgi:hypothetical protein